MDMEHCFVLFVASIVCDFNLKPYKPSLPLSLTAVPVPYGMALSPSPIFLANPSPMHRLASGSSHGPNVLTQHIAPSIKPCTPPSLVLSFSLFTPFLISLFYCSLIARQLRGQPGIGGIDF